METTKTKKPSPLKKVLLITGIVLVVLFILGIVAGNMLYNIALKPDSDKSAVLEADINQLDFGADEGVLAVWDEYSQAYGWLDQNGEQAQITSYDGLRLNSYIVENDEYDGRWAILFHGYATSAYSMSWYGQTFYDEGYSLLIPDARGHGESEGDYIGMGWHERLDALDWIDLILERDADARIVLFGVSMGGATVMMVSGEALPDNVAAIIEDCGYSSVWDEFSYQLNAIFGLPEFPFMNFASLVTKARAGYSMGEASAIEQVKKSDIPIMFIHGDEDTFVPSYMVYEVYEAAACEKELLIAEGAGHAEAAIVLGDTYWEEIFDFIGHAS